MLTADGFFIMMFAKEESILVSAFNGGCAFTALLATDVT